MSATVPFQNLRLPTEVELEIMQAVQRVVESHHYILGREVELFEQEFATYLGVKHAVAVASGTDALCLALLAGGVIRPGAEVIVPALTSPFTAIAVVRAGGWPVFADVNQKTWTLDAESVAGCITEKTVALVPVHLYGNPVDWPPLAKLAEAHDLLVLEDACQAHGALFQGVKVGALGRVAAFSFYPTKNLGAAGDGGAIVTNDELLAAQCRHLRNGGQIGRYVHDQPVFHSRLDEIQAAILRVKLPYLDAWNEQRNKVYRDYWEKLPDCIFPALPPGSRPVAHVAAMCHPQRNRLCAHLKGRGIETLIHYPVPLHQMPAFTPYAGRPCPVAETICGRVLSLPLYLSISEQEQKQAVLAIREFSSDA
ncbi:MAG: DegT/DnrJ/EryC1/StrS family aminotransferase [Acidobacteria bacterium]|nr:DegT/DnrJ/EryC1/StrS family aminotransferase [Acidobacteriota bacterium]